MYSSFSTRIQFSDTHWFISIRYRLESKHLGGHNGENATFVVNVGSSFLQFPAAPQVREGIILVSQYHEATYDEKRYNIMLGFR